MTLSRWATPRLVTARRPGERVVGWLELFYDLVYVAALIQLGQGLVDDPTAAGAGQFVVLFALLWWAWTGTTFLKNRIEADDLAHRGLMIAQMFAIGVLAVLSPEAIGADSAGFAVAYGFIRLSLAAMYAQVWIHIPGVRALARPMGLASAVSAAVWLLSAAVPTPGRYWLWGLAVGWDLATLFAPRMQYRIAHDFPADREHLAERYALFTIIVLGESFIKIVGAVADHGVTAGSFVHIAIAFAITAALWWTYFDDVADSPIKPSSGRIPTTAPWSFLHLPMTIGLTAVGVGLEKLALTPVGEGMGTAATWILVLALATVLLSVAAIDAITTNRHFGVAESVRIVPRLAAAAAVVLIGVAAPALPSTVFGLLLVVVVVAQISVEYVVARRADHAIRVDVDDVLERATPVETCRHLAAMGTVEPASAGCLRCIENGLVWVHLRFCAVCGEVGCCDDSIGRHASEHFLETGHETIRSMEPGEDWAWCYVDKVGLRP